ncbi:DUF1365 domain-containing protein [Aquimonas sp.]|jgi:DUF1365 family protein|uniref:DUF1365 domain-containing protein n=1 Tax=Aquimonas sp. TaxID=1872588 RepID=UPI0037C13838
MMRPPAATTATPVPAQPASPLQSAIYRGQIMHRRHAPHPHAFRYPLFMLYLDLAELEQVFSGRWLWSVGRRNVAAFRREDYLGDPALPLDEAVRQRFEQVSGRRPSGPIRLLSHLRYFGYSFNPVSFYYCFKPDGETLDGIVAEITNTPWKERHSYVLPAETAEVGADGWRWRFDKRFHVSPFMPMERGYDWRFGLPGKDLRVHMNIERPEGRDFDATLSLQREPLSARALAMSLLRHPWMTARVLVAIHWQALLIWCRRNPVYDHPSKSRR